MKKILTLIMALSIFFVGCAKNNDEVKETETNLEATMEETSENREIEKESEADTNADAKKELEVIKVASHTNPMTDMLEMVADDLEQRGYKLELVTVTDNVQANVALNNKEVDANFFQHEPFMEQFNEGNDANLVAVAPVYNALVSFYSKDITDVNELKDGAVVSIPNDPTNMARALRLLDYGKLIELDDPNSFTVTLDNIKSNPKNLEFKEWGLLNLNEAYQESDLTFNYPTYIEALGLTPADNGLIVEAGDDKTFAITVVAREDNKDTDKIKALKDVMQSNEIKDFIEKNLSKHAKPAF